MDSDKAFRTGLNLTAFSFILFVGIIFLTLLSASWPSIKAFGLKFIFSTEWDPNAGKFGALPFLTGTLLTSFLALLISMPLAFSLALFLGIYSRKGLRLAHILDYAVDLLAGIPSVIYGLWALFFLVPVVRWMELKLNITPFGVGIFTASLVLAVMIIPYISSISKEMIAMVPQDLLEAGMALGATDWEVVKNIIIPYCLSGFYAGILLGLGRALGETMAVTMVIGNFNDMPKDIFSPGNTMASVIANEFAEAVGDLHLSSLVQIGLWLFVVNIIVNLIGQVIVRKVSIRR